MTGSHPFYISIRFLHLEIIPCQKTVQCIEILLLRNKTIQPDSFYCFERENQKKLVNLFQIKMQQGFFNQHIVWNILD